MKKLLFTVLIFVCGFANAQEYFSGQSVSSYKWSHYMEDYVIDDGIDNVKLDLSIFWEYKKTHTLILFIDGKFNTYERIIYRGVKGGFYYYNCSEGTMLLYNSTTGELYMYGDLVSGRYTSLIVVNGYHRTIKKRKYKKFVKRLKKQGKF